MPVEQAHAALVSQQQRDLPGILKRRHMVGRKCVPERIVGPGPLRIVAGGSLRQSHGLQRLCRANGGLGVAWCQPCPQRRRKALNLAGAAIAAGLRDRGGNADEFLGALHMLPAAPYAGPTPHPGARPRKA